MQVDFSSFSFAKVLRAAALAVNGVEPVELNPKFMEELIQAAKGEGIILYDEIGGTLDPTATFGKGKTSRSLLAVYQVCHSIHFQINVMITSLTSYVFHSISAHDEDFALLALDLARIMILMMMIKFMSLSILHVIGLETVKLGFFRRLKMGSTVDSVLCRLYKAGSSKTSSI